MIRFWDPRLRVFLAIGWMLGHGPGCMKTQNPPNSSASQGVPAACGPVIAQKHNPAGDRAQPIPPRREGSRVVFADSRLGWLSRDGLYVLVPGGTEKDVLVPLGKGRGVTAAGTSFLAIGQSGVETVVRVSPNGTIERWPAVLPITPFGIVRLFAGDPAASEALWVVGKSVLQPAALRLRGPALETGMPVPCGSAAQPGNQLEVTRLKSGAFLCSQGSKLAWLSPGSALGGAARSVQMPLQFGETPLVAAEPATTTPGQSPPEDRLWIAGDSGGLALLSLDSSSNPLTARLKLCAQLAAENHRVHTLATAPHVVAAVLIWQQAAGQQPVWSVATFSDDGRETFRALLPWQPLMSEETDVSLALSPDGSRLAAGSVVRLVVWDPKTGQQVAERSLPPE